MLPALVIGVVPSSAVAADATAVLPGATVAAGAADLDGDGAREIVRLVDGPSESTVVDAWREARGTWERMGTVPLGVPDEIGNAALSDRTLRAGALLVTRRDGEDRVLALTAETVPDDAFGRTCCLALAEIDLGGDAGLVLRPLTVSGLDTGANVVHAVDLDGDGTDEIVTVTTDPGNGGDVRATRVGVLAWGDDGLAGVGAAEASGGLYGLSPGETNGIVGDDLVGTTDDGTIARITMVDGNVAMEQAAMTGSDPLQSWIAGVADGRVVLANGTAVSLLRWPYRSEPSEEGRLETPEAFVTVVGSGPEALLLHAAADPLAPGVAHTVDVYDLDLERVGDDVRAEPATSVLWRLSARQSRSGRLSELPLVPYVGPLPAGRWSASGGYVHSGALIAPDGRGGYTRRPISALAGIYPVASAGRDDGWLVAGRGVPFAAGPTAYLGPGQLESAGPAQVVAIPADVLFADAAGDEAVAIVLRGQVVDIEDSEGRRLVAGPSGFDVVVRAPPGSVVMQGGRGSAQAEVGDAPVTLTIAPARASADENSELDAWIAVVTPGGAVSTRAWTGTFVADPPALDAAATTEAFAFASRVRGRVSADAAVTIDGRAVRVAPDGTFEARIAAPPWPAGVLVAARDPLGNETATRIEVLGFIDYRGLPWLALAVVATVVAGGYAFIRIPRPREVRRPREDDAVLEDLEES